MKEQDISEQESLVIIREMISTAKNEQRDNGAGWIVWGWLLFGASLFTWLNLQFGWLNPFFFWNAFGILAIILMVAEAIRYFTGRKPRKVRTYTAELFEKLNIGFICSLVLIILSMNIGEEFRVPPVKGFALLLVLYGFWILIYGAILSFRPSIIGAFITWAIALASLFLDDFRDTMLLHAIAVFCGYIIPGHMAYREFMQKRRTG